MLCATCASAFSSTTRSGPHHKTIHDLRSAAELQKCSICLTLIAIARRHGEPNWTQLQDGYLDCRFDFKQDIRGRWAFIINGRLRTSPLNRYPEPALGRDKEKDEKPRLPLANEGLFGAYQLIHTPDTGSITHNQLTSRQEQFTSIPSSTFDGFRNSAVPSDTGDPKLAELGKAWLYNCLHNHKLCNSSRDGDWYPPRLLDVTGCEPRLLIPEIDKPSGPYATLSHCWGPNPTFLQLTLENLESFRVKIPLSSLPKTFQDAIVTTKRLELKYLWIDSLCIIQSGPGSEEDWRDHTLTMRSVFSNCVLNISASRARCADDGCFTTRDPALVLPCPVDWHGFPKGSLRRYQVIHLSFWFCRLHDVPIAERAWALQERLLAPRTLHFSIDQLLWECSELPVACETFPHGPPCKMDVPFFSPFDALSPSRSFLTPGISELRLWECILQDYTRRKLSRPFEDKFVALAGIIEHITSLPGFNGGAYVAGLFRNHLPLALLWHINSSAATVASRAEKYRAPSWSWASLDRPADFSYSPRTGTTLVTIDNVVVDLVDKRNIAGQVRSAELELHGVLFVAALETTRIYTSIIRPRDLRMKVDLGEGRMASAGACLDDIRDEPQGEQHTVVVLPVNYAAREPSRSEGRFSSLDGLVLRAIDDGIRPRYVRLGTFSAYDADAQELREVVKTRPRQPIVMV